VERTSTSCSGTEPGIVLLNLGAVPVACGVFPPWDRARRLDAGAIHANELRVKQRPTGQRRGVMFRLRLNPDRNPILLLRSHSALERAGALCP
jgi:hypothetical protein